MDTNDASPFHMYIKNPMREVCSTGFRPIQHWSDKQRDQNLETQSGYQEVPRILLEVFLLRICHSVRVGDYVLGAFYVGTFL